ncbi:hypothetical protein JOH51_003003 [Rhizobium leguminosarum]|nr:hypothetical protein [Rhizobium leguminosarum]
MKKVVSAFLLACTAIAVSTGVSMAQDAKLAPISDYVTSDVKPWLNDPVVIEAIKAQNVANANLGQGDIDALDKKWRAEVDGSDHSMIDGVLGNALSKYLQEKKAASNGKIAEVFVMDAKGLNVGQSDPTSDYWQGDEGKFQSPSEPARTLFSSMISKRMNRPRHCSRRQASRFPTTRERRSAPSPSA